MLETILDLLPTLLLIAGGCALAVWAKGLKDQQSTLVSRLTRRPETPEPTAKEDGVDERSAADD